MTCKILNFRIGLSQFALCFLFFIGVAMTSGIAQTETAMSKEYLTMIVEFQTDRQVIYISGPTEKPRQIVFLPTLKNPNNIAKNIRLKDLDYYKTNGYEVRKTKLVGPYDHRKVYELIKEIEAGGWNLMAQDFSVGGAADNHTFTLKRATHYSFSRAMGG